jgi:hypothetical protein
MVRCKPAILLFQVQRFRPKAHLIHFTHSIGLKINAHAKGFDLRDGFKYGARYTDLMQSERNAQAANACTGDGYWRIDH